MRTDRWFDDLGWSPTVSLVRTVAGTQHIISIELSSEASPGAVEGLVESLPQDLASDWS